MKFSLNRLALVIGASILALMVIDGLIQYGKSALPDYGFGQHQWVAADSLMAVFLVGLVAGTVFGIAIFFAYLVWRERKYNEDPDEIEALFDELAREAEEDDALFVEENSMDEQRSESLDPWERSADWWKQADDD
ncbi:MAG: hypothetical protein WD342_00950 [Verrucomicrobiales bacterium]